MQGITSQKSELFNRIKIVFLGDRGVGKSSIIKRFMTNKFQQFQKSTIGMDFFTKKMKFNGRIYKLELWDTAGQQQFKSLVKNYIRDADVYIYVYDCQKPETFKSIPEWIKTVRQVSNRKCHSIIAGNKCELQFNPLPFQAIKTEEYKKYCYLRKYPSFKVSAKCGNNIFELIESILQHVDSEFEEPIKVESNLCIAKISIVTQSVSSAFIQKYKNYSQCC